MNSTAPLSSLDKAKRMEEVSRLLLTGITTRAVAEKIGLSQSAVMRIKKHLQAAWIAASTEAVDQIKARELAKLDLWEAEVIAEWEKSKKDYTKKTVEDKPAGSRGGGGKSAKIETGGQCGDPRYIQALISIQDRRAKILGVDAPSKIAPTKPDGSPLDLTKEHRDAVFAAAVAAATAQP